MKRKYLSVLLPVLTIGCLLSTPLVSNKPIALLSIRLIGTIAGFSTLLRKTETELSWLEEEKRHLSEERDELSKRYIADTEILEGWVKDESIRLSQAANERIKAMESQIDALVDEAYSEAELWQSKALELEQRLQSYLLPRKPSGVSRLEVIASRVVDFYYSKGILLDYEESWTDSDFDLIRVKPRSGGREQLQKLGEELQLFLKLSKQPSFNISQGAIQIRLETAGIDTKLQSATPVIQEPSKEFLQTIVTNNSSFRVNGESGSGKSTFVRHLISLLDGEVVLVDPKYPMSDWDMKPKYRGIEEALEGLQEAADLVENRLALARSDKDAGKVIRTFKRVTYIFDEIDWVITHFGQDAANLLRVTLKVGRALAVNILYLGQTPLATRLKMNRDDFRHSASFFLGENIPAAIEETCFSSSLKSELQSQYVLRQQSKEKYFMLIKYPGCQPFIASNPKPISIGNQEQPSNENRSNSEVIADNIGYQMVPDSSQMVPDDIPDDIDESKLIAIAKEALDKGISRTDIVKKLWGYAGRRYPTGIALWGQLGLNGSQI